MSVDTEPEVANCTICSDPCEDPPIVSIAAVLRGNGGVWDFCSLKCLRYWTNDELPSFFDMPDESRPYE